MKTTLYIQNFKCGGCEKPIINKLSHLKNINKVSVNKTYATVTFEYKTPEEIKTVKEALSTLGYPPFGEKNNLVKKSKSYMSCAIGKISKAD